VGDRVRVKATGLVGVIVGDDSDAVPYKLRYDVVADEERRAKLESDWLREDEVEFEGGPQAGLGPELEVAPEAFVVEMRRQGHRNWVVHEGNLLDLSDAADVRGLSDAALAQLVEGAAAPVAAAQEVTSPKQELMRSLPDLELAVETPVPPSVQVSDDGTPHVADTCIEQSSALEEGDSSWPASDIADHIFGAHRWGSTGSVLQSDGWTMEGAGGHGAAGLAATEAQEDPDWEDVAQPPPPPVAMLEQSGAPGITCFVAAPPQVSMIARAADFCGHECDLVSSCCGCVAHIPQPGALAQGPGAWPQRRAAVTAAPLPALWVEALPPCGRGEPLRLSRAFGGEAATAAAMGRGEGLITAPQASQLVEPPPQQRHAAGAAEKHEVLEAWLEAGLLLEDGSWVVVDSPGLADARREGAWVLPGV